MNRYLQPKITATEDENAASEIEENDSIFNWSTTALKKNGTQTFNSFPPANNPKDINTRCLILSLSLGHTYTIIAFTISNAVTSGALIVPIGSLAKSGLLKWKWLRVWRPKKSKIFQGVD